MSFLEKIKNLINNNSGSANFNWNIEKSGVNFVVPQGVLELATKGVGSNLLLLQYAHLTSFEEQGIAERFVNGFFIHSEDISSVFEEAEQTLFKLPKIYAGEFYIQTSGNTKQSNFKIGINPVINGTKIHHSELVGPILKLGEHEQYLLDEISYGAVNAIELHRGLDDGDKCEVENLKVIKALKEAKIKGLDIDLSQFEKLDIYIPENVSITATEMEDGGLVLTPNFGNGVSPELVHSRLGQISSTDSNEGSLRVNNQIVVLDESRYSACMEIIENRNIPKSQVKQFLQTPSAFIDAALVDLDTGFSIKVLGAAKFVHMDVGGLDQSDTNWFDVSLPSNSPFKIKELIETTEELESFSEVVEHARSRGAEEVLFKSEKIDISDFSKVEKVISQIKDEIEFHDRDELSESSAGKESNTESCEEKVALLLDDSGLTDEADLLKIAEHASYNIHLDTSDYLRQPYQHQKIGVEWLLGLMNESCKQGSDIKGALLADDMGLGKTYMALASIEHLYKIYQSKEESKKPVLLVAPLSLLQNWKDEVDKTFNHSPFDEIVILQTDSDLGKFRIKGAGRETLQDIGEEEILTAESIRYSLKIGKGFGVERLDMPKRFILTTYATLANYQFSLCRVDWSVVIFDEAQNIKNPNTFQTRAAKGLKADFKLVATGTPVENSLLDFWCVMDTAQPGLLGDWEDFKENYILPIQRASKEHALETQIEVGKQLRKQVGSFMLRRLKEDELDDMPKKTIFTGVQASSENDYVYDDKLAGIMSGEQLSCYDQVMQDFQEAKEDTESNSAALATLMKLRNISLHPDLADSDLIDSEFNPNKSKKLDSLVEILEIIRSRNEKVLIFVVCKKLQVYLRLWLQKKYELNVNIINGDVKTKTKKKSVLTRTKMIEDFEAKEGFNIMILSPVAAGVGLTITGANNVIHLERHWNPAKEAQATDRVYRIGQKLPVSVYLPILHHPDSNSFDVNLSALLDRKTNLKDAVVTPQVVDQVKMIKSF